MAAVIRGVAHLNSFVTAVALDENGVATHDFCVAAATRKNREQPEAGTRTLGDLLYANKATFPVSEKDWVRLVQAIAAGDQLALHSLYEQAHRIVFTLVLRITVNRETAEEVTIDVFHDVWRKASTYDPVNGGFGGAPKFPPSMTLDFLMQVAWRTNDRSLDEIIVNTLTKMARGDGQDLSDVQFLLQREPLSQEALHAAFSRARVPNVPEIGELFLAAQPKVLALISTQIP